MAKIPWKKLWEWVGNKFFLTLLIFIVWLVVFDRHNLVDRYKTRRHLNQLRKDTSYYHQKIQEDRKSILMLETDKDNLEKFARERYLMKAPDEDIFVIIKE